MQSRRPTGAAGATHAGLRLALQSFTLLLHFLFPFLLAFFAPAAMPASNVVQYTYDAAGNITNIQRQSAAGFAITNFTPTSGPVGTAVTIYGTGFDPTPANNIVKFNGIAATVTASASGSISAAVPSGATTGPISVTVGAATATSSQSFTVTVPGAPTITNFSPTIAAAGTTVTVIGSNFDPAAGATTVKVNGVTATATVSDSSNLTFTVPASAASGAVTVTTAVGTGTASTDFIVPPAGISASDIASTLRIVPGAPYASISVPAASKNGIVLFDLEPNTYYSIQLSALAISPTSTTVAYKVVKPDNTVLQSGSLGGSNRPSIHVALPPASGTYSLVLSPASATLNTNVRIEANPIVTLDGPSAASNLDFASQSARFAFDATANQQVGLGFAGVTLTPTVVDYSALQVFAPDGTSVPLQQSASCLIGASSNPERNCDWEIIAPVTGRYTAIYFPPFNTYAAFGFFASSDVAGTLNADVSQPVALTRVGQDARYTFTANAGDSVAIDFSNAAMQPRPQSVTVTVYAPNGTYFSSASATPPRALYVELGTLAASGTYSVWVDPDAGAYGTFNLNLKQGPLLQTTDAPISYAPQGITENARFRFNAVAGQNLSLGFPTFSSGGVDSYVKIYAPDRTQVPGPTCHGGVGHCGWMLTNLPQTGVYSVQVQPPDAVKVSGMVNVSDDLVGTLTAESPVALSASRTGQVARYAFAGAAGGSALIQLYGVTTNPHDGYSDVVVQVNKPDGGYLNSVDIRQNMTSGLLNIVSLPTTGNYTVIVNSTYGVSWNGSLELDAGIPISIDGPTVSPTGAVGQALRYTFSATAGQRVEFGMSGLAYDAPNGSATNVTVYSPTGSNVMNVNCYTAYPGCETFTASIPTTGTYSVVLTPPSSAAITGGTFALSTPVAGSFVINDPAQSVAIARPGQTARYTFSGTAAQLLRLGWTSPVVSGGQSVQVSVLKPDGSSLATGNISNGVDNGFPLASLPTTGTYTIVFDPGSAASMSASVSLTTQ